MRKENAFERGSEGLVELVVEPDVHWVRDQVEILDDVVHAFAEFYTQAKVCIRCYF